MHPYLLELIAVCAIIDTVFTYHRIQWEMNPLIKRLAHQVGPGLASVIGVLGVQLLITTPLAMIHSPIPLSILVGVGINRSWMQLLSIELEDNVLHAGSSVPPALAGLPERNQ